MKCTERVILAFNVEETFCIEVFRWTEIGRYINSTPSVIFFKLSLVLEKADAMKCLNGPIKVFSDIKPHHVKDLKSST